MNKKERLDVMVDMETLGTAPGSIILSVAMKTFTLDGGASAETLDYHQHISVLDSLWHHLTSDYATEEWWMNQSGTAKKKVREGQNDALSLETTMLLIYELLTKWNKEYNLYLWGRGVGSFDLPLLDEAMRRVVSEGYKTPWNYWAAMDVRSIQNFCYQCGLEKKSGETPHDAREDVIKQIKEVQTCWQYVRVERAI